MIAMPRMKQGNFMESRSRDYENIAFSWKAIDSLRAKINVIAEGPWRAFIFSINYTL